MVLVLVLRLLSSRPLFNYAPQEFLGFVFLVLINAGWILVFLIEIWPRAKVLFFSPLDCLLYQPCLTRRMDKYYFAEIEASCSCLAELYCDKMIWLKEVHLHVAAGHGMASIDLRRMSWFTWLMLVLISYCCVLIVPKDLGTCICLSVGSLHAGL